MKEMEAIEFIGLHKVGGTTPFLVSALSGCTFFDWEVGVVFPPGKTECPLIWEKYAEKGYRTVLSQDEIWLTVYRFLRQDHQGKPKIQHENLHYIKGLQSTYENQVYTFG